MALLNPSFEDEGALPGEAEHWTLTAVTGLEVLAGFGAAPEDAWEDFERWFALLASLDDVTVVLAFFDSALKGYEEFDSGWANAVYLYELPPAQLHAQQLVKGPAGPLAAAHQALTFAEPARNPQDQRPRQIGCRSRQHIGCVGDDDTALACRRDVDVVVANGNVGDDLQRGSDLEHLAVDRIGQHGHHGLLASNARQQLAAGHRAAPLELLDVAGRLQSGDHGRGNLTGQKDRGSHSQVKGNRSKGKGRLPWRQCP